jgi:hypothetical protein
MLPYHDCYLQLSKHWQQAMEGSSEKPSIWFCHRTGSTYEGFQPFGGLHAAREDLMRKKSQSKPFQPILVFGFQSQLLVCDKANEYWLGSGALFDWPGAEYLRYDATPDEFRAAAQRVIEGAKQPLPKNLLLQAGDLLRISSEVRHWLENRRINVTGMLDNFRGALRGERLSPFHLNSQPAISKEHQEMVSRLWAYESLVSGLARASGGIVPLRAAMDDFEQAWSVFDVAREGYRLELESGGTGKGQIESVINQLEKVVAAVRKAIEATYTLDAALQKKKR